MKRTHRAAWGSTGRLPAAPPTRALMDRVEGVCCPSSGDGTSDSWTRQRTPYVRTPSRAFRPVLRFDFHDFIVAVEVGAEDHFSRLDQFGQLVVVLVRLLGGIFEIQRKVFRELLGIPRVGDRLRLG